MCHNIQPLYANLDRERRFLSRSLNNETSDNNVLKWPPDQNIEQSGRLTTVWDSSHSTNLREADRCFGTGRSVSKLTKDVQDFGILHRNIPQHPPPFIKNAAECQHDSHRGILEAGTQPKENVAVPAPSNQVTQKKPNSLVDLTKESDMSDFEDDSEPHDENNPLDSGWEHSLFVRKFAISDDVNLFSREKLFYNVQVDSSYAKKFGEAIYIRYKKRRDGSYMMFPSSRHYSAIVSLKVRPQKSVEMKLTGVVGFSNFPERSIPVCDILGWQTIYTQQHGLLRRGLAKVDEERVRKPLVILEFTVHIRTDIPSQYLPMFSDSIKITDLAPLKYLNGKSSGEIAGDFYPKEPKRIDDLKYACRDQDGNLLFTSVSHPDIKVRASLEQCAILKSEKDMAYCAIVVPDKKDLYRGLVIAPKMRFVKMCSNRLFDYKRILTKRMYSNNHDNVAKNTNIIFSNLFKNRNYPI